MTMVAGGTATRREQERSRTWRRREAELVAETLSLRAAVAEVLGREVAIPAVSEETPWRAAEAISVLIGSCTERLHRLAPSDRRIADRLCSLIVELQRFALEIYLDSVRARSERMADCSTGLGRLRGMSSTGDLLDQVCEEAVRRCGFGRVVLSRVDGRTWRPWMAYSIQGAELASWFSGWVDQGIELDGRFPEAMLLRDRRPSIVYDTDAVPVHRPIIVDSGHSRSYVVAPIMQAGAVVGFLHADHDPSARRVDETDRDVLWAFSAGFGYVYERTVLLERLRTQRDQAREILTEAVARIDELCETTGERVLAGGISPAGADGADESITGAFGELTPREAEVFRLMAEGATNAAISDRLVITEDTVKSHVKRILRKLGAANRSQTVAWSLRERSALEDAVARSGAEATALL